MSVPHPLDWKPHETPWVRPFLPTAGALSEVNQYTALHQLLWGAPEEAYERNVTVKVAPFADADDDGLEPKTDWTIHWLMSPEAAHPLAHGLAEINHLVLREYPGMLSRIEIDIEDYRKRHQVRPRGTVIVGQPGIGKTQFQYYVLFKRLKNRQPTVIWIPAIDQYMLMHDAVSVYSHGNDVELRISELGLLMKDVVLLFDAGSGHGPPASTWMKSWWTVLTTSPVEYRYKDWVKQAGATIYWTYPNTWDEIYVILHVMHRCKLDKINLARDAFCAAGPMLRLCVDAALIGPTSLNTFLAQRFVAINDLLRTKDLQLIVDNFSREISTLPPDKLSHKAFLAVPKPSRLTATLRHASMSVGDQLLQVFCMERGILAKENWDALTQAEGVGSFSGVMYEGAVRRTFIERRPLPVVGDPRVLQYMGSGRALNDTSPLRTAEHVLRYSMLEEAAVFIKSHLFDDCVLIPKAKNQATFDLFQTTWINKQTVKLTLYQITVGASHDLKSTALHDLWYLFHSNRFPDVAIVDFRLVFVVPPKVFDRWTKAVVPKDLTTNQENGRKKKGETVFGSDHWCSVLAQYAVSVDMTHLLREA